MTVWYLPDGFLTAGFQIINGTVLYNGTGWCTTLVETQTGDCISNETWQSAGKECVSNGVITTYWWPTEMLEALKTPPCHNNTVDSWMMGTTILNTLTSTGAKGKPFEWMEDIITQIYTIPSDKEIINCALQILSWNLSLINPDISMVRANQIQPSSSIIAKTVPNKLRQRRAIDTHTVATLLMWTDPRLGLYALVNEGNEAAMKRMQDEITNLSRQQVDINRILTNMSEINADEHQLTRQMIREGLCGVELSLQRGFSQLSLRASLNTYLQNIQAIINAVLDGKIGPLVISFNLATNITRKYAPTLDILDFYRVARFHQKFLHRNKTYYLILAIPVPAKEQRQVYIPVSLPKRFSKRIIRSIYPENVRVVGSSTNWAKTRLNRATYLDHTIIVSPAATDLLYEVQPYKAPASDAPTYAIVTPWGIWGKCRDDPNGTLIAYGTTTYWCFYSGSNDAWEHTESGPPDLIPTETYQPIEIPTEFPSHENYMWENLAEQPKSSVTDILKAIEEQSRISTLYELVKELRNKTESQGMSVERFANMVFNNKEAKEILNNLREKFKGAFSWVGNFIGMFTGPFRYAIYAVIAILVIVVIGIAYKILKIFICVATPVGYAGRAGIYYAGEIPRDFLGIARTGKSAWNWTSNQIRRALRRTGQRVGRITRRRRFPRHPSEEDLIRIQNYQPTSMSKHERVARATWTPGRAAVSTPSAPSATERLISRVQARTNKLFGRRDHPERTSEERD